MSEHTPQQIEDPLPFVDKGYGPHNEKDLPRTLGELIVTDAKDPFVWLTSVMRPESPPTEDGKHLLWATYRADGNLPEDITQLKWRDEALMSQKDALQVSHNDLRYVALYQKHLDSFKPYAYLTEQAAPSAKHVSHEAIIQLHVPNSELIAMLFGAALKGLQDTPSYKRTTVEKV